MSNNLKVEIEVWMRRGTWRAACELYKVKSADGGHPTRAEALVAVKSQVFKLLAEGEAACDGVDFVVKDQPSIPDVVLMNRSNFERLVVTSEPAAVTLQGEVYSNGDRSGSEGWLRRFSWRMDVDQAKRLRGTLDTFIEELEANVLE